MVAKRIRDLVARPFAAGDQLEIDDGSTSAENYAVISAKIAALFNAADARAARQVLSAGSYFSPIDYGAIGSGLVDDRAANQATIEAAALVATAEKPQIVYFPAGYTFAVGSSMVCRAYVHIIIHGTIVRLNAATASSCFSLFTALALPGVRIDGDNRMGSAWGVGIERRQAASLTDVSSLGGRDSFLDAKDCTGQISVTGMNLRRFVNHLLIGAECPDNYLVGNRLHSDSPKTLASIDDGSYVAYGTPTGDPGAGIRFLGERGGVQVLTDGTTNVVAHNHITAIGLDICVDVGSQSHARIPCIVSDNWLEGAEGSGLQNYTANGAPLVDTGTFPGTDRRCQWSDNYITLCRQQGMYIRQTAAVQAKGNWVYRCGTVGTYVGTSCGGIVLRGPTIASYDKSPLANDHWVDLDHNWVIDCGNPLTGEIDSSVRLDSLNVRFANNIIVRTIERFGANRYHANSVGVRTTELSPATAITGTGTTNGTVTLTMTSLTGCMPGNRVTISGETGEFTIKFVDTTALTATLDRACATSSAGHTVTVVAASYRCNLRKLEWFNNTIIGHKNGVQFTFTNWSRQNPGALEMTGGYIEAELPLFLSMSQAGPKISGMTLRSDGGAYCATVKSSPFTEFKSVRMYGGTNCLVIDNGNTLADYWQSGGRMGATLKITDCDFNEFTTASITHTNTATGDINLISRASTCKGNRENGHEDQPNSTLSADSSPVATGAAGGYRSYRANQPIPRRTMAASTTPKYICVTSGSYGATIPGTVTTTNGLATATFSSMSGIVPDIYLAITGVTGTKRVVSIDPPTLSVTFDSACDANAAVVPTHVAPTFKTEAALSA